MVGNIILFLISFFAICIMLYLSYRAIKKSNSLAEKISEIVLAMVMAVILVIYYLKINKICLKNVIKWLNLG